MRIQSKEEGKVFDLSLTREEVIFVGWALARMSEDFERRVAKLEQVPPDLGEKIRVVQKRFSIWNRVVNYADRGEKPVHASLSTDEEWEKVPPNFM
jgi:hypothetical protein